MPLVNWILLQISLTIILIPYWPTVLKVFLIQFNSIQFNILTKMRILTNFYGWTNFFGKIINFSVYIRSEHNFVCLSCMALYLNLSGFFIFAFFLLANKICLQNGVIFNFILLPYLYSLLNLLHIYGNTWCYFPFICLRYFVLLMEK